ncbi:MAG: S8 family serine peptidase [Candidatus Sericytochromatia bacterium]|nr:S8 family serine peptidase [Candidatus Sericytochromatia bacterium]
MHHPTRPVIGALLLAMTGCQAPPPGLPTALPSAAANPAPYRLSSTTEPLAVIVRHRPGRLGATHARARLLRTLRLDRTEVLRASSVADRDALLAALRADPDVEWAEPDHRLFMTASPPNDPAFGQQWALPRIQAPAAWDLGQGAGVQVAVLDTGVDLNHPDLAGQVVAGPDLVDRDAQPQDEQGHGTHVAGTIAALTNNNQGVAGVAPAARVLAIRVLDAQGSGALSDVADGVLEAVRRGAKVINMSLGGDADGQTLRAAIAEAVAAGVLVVVAAGNENTSRATYPAAYPDVLAVGATTASDQRASFSNYGTYVGIAAPGDRILSTKLGGGTTTLSGTSMASPHVAAAAALVWGANPTLTAAEVRTALTRTGAPVAGFTRTPEVRRLDALAALQAAQAPGAPPAPAPEPSEAPSPEPPGVPSPGPSVAPSPVPTATPQPTPVPAPTARPPRAPRIGRLIALPRATQASVRWLTSVAASSQVVYGRTPQLEEATAPTAALVTAHRVELTNLRRRSTYYYKVRSRDAEGRVVESRLRTFRTRLY